MKVPSFIQPVGGNTAAVVSMVNVFYGATAMSDCSKASVGHSDRFGQLLRKAQWSNLPSCVRMDANFKPAFWACLANLTSAAAKCGPIKDWDVSQGTNTLHLFVDTTSMKASQGHEPPVLLGARLQPADRELEHRRRAEHARHV